MKSKTIFVTEKPKVKEEKPIKEKKSKKKSAISTLSEGDTIFPTPDKPKDPPPVTPPDQPEG